MDRKLMLIVTILVALSSSFVDCARKKTTKNPVASENFSSDCYFDIPKDIPKNEPVYLLKKGKKGGFEILHPNEPRQRFNVDDEITLFCPTKRNMFTNGWFL